MIRFQLLVGKSYNLIYYGFSSFPIRGVQVWLFFLEVPCLENESFEHAPLKSSFVERCELEPGYHDQTQPCFVYHFVLESIACLLRL